MHCLSQRSTQNELMDDPSICFDEFQQTLGEIEKINKRLGSYQPTFKALVELIGKHPQKNPVKILDIGFGNGDFLRKIHTWASKQGMAVELSGVDLNPWSKKAAEIITPPEMNIHYITSNIFDFKAANSYDFIINSLFTHHLCNSDIVKVMQWMTQHAQLGWMINDLHRHILPYSFIYLYVRLFGYNRLVKNDAPLSVARSFSKRDWEILITDSGLNKNKIHVSWHWPFRYGILYNAS